MTSAGVLLPGVLCAAAVLVVGVVPRPVHLRLHSVVPPGGAGAGGTAGQERSARPGASAGLLGAAGATIGLLLGGPVLAVLALGAVVVARRWTKGRARASAQAHERARAAEVCATLAAELRAGRSPAEALAVAAGLAAGPSQEALRSGAAAARLGGDVPAALLTATDITAVPELLKGLAACWQVCSRAGGGLAAGVERLGEGLRARQEQDLAVDAALSGPKATAALLAVLPVAGVALAAGLGARPLHVLLHTPLGAVCLLIGCALDALGVWFTGRLVAAARGAR